MVFRKRGRLQGNVSFYYDGAELEIGNKYVYLKPHDAETVILETDLFNPTLTDMILILLFLQNKTRFFTTLLK